MSILTTTNLAGDYIGVTLLSTELTGCNNNLL